MWQKTITFLTILSIGCGGTQPINSDASSKTILSTQSDKPDQDAQKQPPEAGTEIDANAQRSQSILNDSLSIPKRAGWAAVYIAFLQIDADPDALYQSLFQCAQSKDMLLQTLCWRHLAAYKTGAIPKVPPHIDPAAAIFVDIARRQRAMKTPKSPLRPPDALDMSTSDFAGVAVPILKALDNGAVIDALNFYLAKRQRHGTIENGVTLSSARKYLQKLVNRFNIAAPAQTDKRDTLTPRSKLLKLRNAPFLQYTIADLHQLVQNSAPSLRVSALRALAAKVAVPSHQDLKAIATQLDNSDALVQIEAARTYLLFISVAAQNGPAEKGSHD